MKDAFAKERSTKTSAHRKTPTSADLLEQLKKLELGMKRRWKCRPPFPNPVEPANSAPEKMEEGNEVLWIDKKVRIVDLQPIRFTEPLSPIVADGFLGYDPVQVAYEYESAISPTPVKGGKLKASVRGKHLCLVVDLSIPLDDLVAEIERHVGRYRSYYTSRHPGRNKPNREVGDIWTVYDAVRREQSVAKVAAPLAEQKRSDSSVTTPDKAADSAIRRAFSKAKRFIQQVEREAGLEVKLPFLA